MGLLWIIGVSRFCAYPAYAQIESHSHSFSRSEVPHAIRFFAPFFVPKLIQDIYHLKEYIREEELKLIRQSDGDLAAVDAIYTLAFDLSWGNIYETLLISCVATMDHRRFGIRLPVVGDLLWVPLTSEFEDAFHLRVGRLPSKLYSDTPRGDYGDRDKLQHFFGSAFLTYFLESYEAAERVGWFVEFGEERFIVGGALDARDSRANKQGQEFGLQLLGNEAEKPSRFLQMFVNEDGTTPSHDSSQTVQQDSVALDVEAR